MIQCKGTGFDPAIHVGEREGYTIKRISDIESIQKVDVSEPICIIDTSHELGYTIQEDLCLPLSAKEIEEEKLKQNVQAEKKDKKVTTEIERMISEKCGPEICKKYGELVVTGVKKADNKNQFYQFFRTNLGDSLGLELYRNVIDKFKDMKALV